MTQTQTPTKPDIKDVVKALNFEIERKPIAIAGTNKLIDGRQVILRKDTQEPLSIVSDDYRLLPHGEVMAKPMEFLEGNGFSVNRFYFIREGAKALVELTSTNVMKIAGDNYKLKLFMLNSYDKTSAFKVQYGLFRLKCLNGLGFWMAGKYSKMSILHIGKDKLFEDDKDSVIKLISNQNTYLENFEGIMNKLTDIKIGDDAHAQKILKEYLKFGPRTSKKIIDEWKKDINYAPNLAGLYHGITSYYSRKVEESEENKAGAKVLNGQWWTNNSLHMLAQMNG